MKTKNFEKKSDDFVADETMDEEDVKNIESVINTPDEESTNTAKSTKTIRRPQSYIVTVPNLALRMGPGTNFDKLGIAPSGHVLVDEIKDGFGRLADGSGWICLEYARKVN